LKTWRSPEQIGAVHAFVEGDAPGHLWRSSLIQLHLHFERRCILAQSGAIMENVC